eukprot:SAG31_NODE_3372_length_4351_cov_4.835842_3_plen_79_part_00
MPYSRLMLLMPPARNNITLLSNFSDLKVIEPLKDVIGKDLQVRQVQMQAVCPKSTTTARDEGGYVSWHRYVCMCQHAA